MKNTARFVQWVAVDPDGNAVYTACIPRCHEERRSAVDAACTMARYADELAEQDRQKKLGINVSCDWDDYTWAMAYRRGWRVRKATCTVKR